MVKLTKLEDVLTFGKYKGKTVEDVYYENAGYLCWLIHKTERTNFRKFLIKNIEIAAAHENGYTQDYDEDDYYYEDLANWGDRD